MKTIEKINKIIEDTFLISENPDKEQKGYSYPCYVTKFQYECIKEQLREQILSLIEEMIGEDEKLPSFQNSTQFSEDGGEAIQGRNELRKEMRSSIKELKEKL